MLQIKGFIIKQIGEIYFLLPDLIISLFFIPISVIAHEVGHLTVFKIYSLFYKPEEPLIFKSSFKICNEFGAGVTTVYYKIPSNEPNKEYDIVNYEDFLKENGKILSIILMYLAGFLFQIGFIILSTIAIYYYTNLEIKLFNNYENPIYSMMTFAIPLIGYAIFTFLFSKRNNTSDLKEIIKYFKILMVQKENNKYNKLKTKYKTLEDKHNQLKIDFQKKSDEYTILKNKYDNLKTKTDKSEKENQTLKNK